jgi:hypothetical protein
MGNQGVPTNAVPAVADADTQDGFSNDSPSTRAPRDQSVKQPAGWARQSHPDTQQTSGAGPAMAERSKDAANKKPLERADSGATRRI